MLHEPRCWERGEAEGSVGGMLAAVFLACPLCAQDPRAGALSGSRETEARSGPGHTPSLLQSSVHGVVYMPHTSELSRASARCFGTHSPIPLSPQPCKARPESDHFSVEKTDTGGDYLHPSGVPIPSLGLPHPSPSFPLFPVAVAGYPLTSGHVVCPRQ